MNQRGLIPISLILYGIAAASIVGALYGLYHHGVTTGRADVQTKWDTAVREQREKEEKQAATASTKLETSNAKSKIIYKTITQTVDKIVKEPVYLRVCFDDAGLSVANNSLRGPSGAPGKPDQPVSKPVAAHGWHWSLSLAENR